MKRKRFSRLLFLMLTIMITVTFYQPAQAASGKYTGTYTKTCFKQYDGHHQAELFRHCK